MIYKDNKRALQKQTSKDRPDNVGMMIKGSANPYKHHVDNENQSKIKEYKKKMQSHY